MESLAISKVEIESLTSLEVVDLINKFRLEEGNTTAKEHKDFMKSIRAEIEVLKKAEIGAEGNFTPGSYTDKNNQQRPCYQLNKAGIMQMLNKESALVRYKTQQYIEGLEVELKQVTKPLSSMQLLKLQYKALEEQDQKIEEVKEDLRDFKADIPLFTVECEEVSKTVQRVGVKVLGGKGSKAYVNKSLRAKVYADIHRQLKREFDVKSYKAIKRRYLKDALDMVESYILTIALNEQINMLNNQVAFA